MTQKDLIEREELLEDILDALEDGDYEETEDLADEAIEAFPQEAFGYYYMAEALFFQGDLEDAIHYYSLAIERAGDNPDYKARLALMHAKLGEEERAEQIYKKIIEQHDSHTPSLVALGVYAVNDSRAEEALTYLNKAIDTQVDYQDAYKVRSITYTALGDYKAALEDLEVVLEQSPTDSQLWLQKIQLLDYNTDKTAVVEAFEAWIALEPEESSRYYAYAVYLSENNLLEQAEEAYSKAIEYQIYGNYAALESFLGRAKVRLSQQKSTDAIADFTQVVDLDTKRVEAYLGIADARYQLGNLDAALAYLDIGLAAVIDEPWVLLRKKGNLLMDAKQFEAAQTAFEAILTYDEEAQAEGYFCLGQLYQSQGDLQKAFENWRKASDIFHLEADRAIDLYCSELVEKELKEKEVALLGDMHEQFQENKKSPILQKLFGVYWTVDWKATLANNEMLKKMPSEFEKPFKETLNKLCITLTAEGFLLVNPGQGGVRVVYSIEKEDTKQVTIEGTPLDGSMKRSFTLLPKGEQLIIQGFGDEDADIDVCLQKTAAKSLASPIKQALKKLDAAGELSYMGSDFQLP